MKLEDYWERFAKTGNVYDYLNYIACTSEDSTQQSVKEYKEGGYIGDSSSCNGDSSICHADWGLR
jgi:hypothetical protein